MSDDVEEALEAALRALDDSVAAALEHLLVAWRIHRQPQIADLIDLASKACRVGQEPLIGEKATHLAEWDRVAKLQDPADLERLIEALLMRDSEKTVLRLMRLREWEANPHFSAAFAEHIPGNVFIGKHTRKVFERNVEDLLLEIRDARIPERISPRTIQPSRFKEARKSWPTPPALNDTLKALVLELHERLERRLTKEASSVDDGKKLLANVYAAPDDDAPRVVYSDWLIERKDAHGEFIALQLRGENRGRQKELLDKHWRDWLDDVSAFLSRKAFTFDRGFLATAKLGMRSGVNANFGLDVRGWDTCRKIDLSGTLASPDGVLYALAGSSHLGGLREIVGIDSRALERVARGTNAAGTTFHPERLARLRDRIERIETDGPHFSLGLFPFPALRELTWKALGLPFSLFGAASENASLVKLERFVYTNEHTKDVLVLQRDKAGALREVDITRVSDRDAAKTMCSSLGLSVVEPGVQAPR